MAYVPNTGRLPEACIVLDPESGEVKGYRSVHVRMFGGWDSKKSGHAPWPAAGAV